MGTKNNRPPSAAVAALTTGARGCGVFGERTLDQLSIEDERSFRHVGLYADLKEVLLQAGYRFRVLPASDAGNWDRALLLNLTFWQPEDGGDLLVDETIPADVVAHVAWHHLAAQHLTERRGGTPEAPSVQALFMGEAIASAFDLYLVGRLLGHAPDSSFLATQVPAMTETAEAAGMSDEMFAALLQQIADAPERAFADLRELLFDATNALYASRDAAEAWTALKRLDSHRFAVLMHRYELSNWVLYARAYGGAGDTNASVDAQTRALDLTLRAQTDPLEWLTKNWL